MSTPFTISFFDDIAARSVCVAELSLEQLAELVETTSAARKDLLPWLKCAVFGDQFSAKGSLRWDSNVQCVTGVEGDLDNGVLSYDEVVNRLTTAGVEALVYTSPSYTEAHPRLRIICPCSGPLPPGRREHLVGRLNGVLDGNWRPSPSR